MGHPVTAVAVVYRRRRLAALVLAAMLLLALGAGARVVAGSLGNRPPAVPEAVPPSAAGIDTAAGYVVRPGDTLWTIARRIQPAGDVRGLVDRLADANGGAALDVGDIIRLQ